ncbi:MAG: hypothetical protein QM581_07070 [Pseudomonas sp.]
MVMALCGALAWGLVRVSPDPGMPALPALGWLLVGAGIALNLLPKRHFAAPGPP